MGINCGALSVLLIFLGAVLVGTALTLMPEDFTLASTFGVTASLKVKPLGVSDLCGKMEGIFEECEG